MQKNLTPSFIILLLHCCIDIYYFNILSHQGYLFVIILNTLIQSFIFYFAVNVATIKKFKYYLYLLIIIILNCILFFYKINFIISFNKLGIADASADLIALKLFECNLCESPKQIALNELFIIYVYILISFLAGEYNNSIIWLAFNVFIFLSALNCYKIIILHYPNIPFPWLIPIIFLIFPDGHGANLALFKDNIIVFFCSWFFLINIKFIKKIELGFKEQIFLIFIIIMLYSLRSGLMSLILALFFLNCIFNPRNILLNSRIFFIAFCIIFALGQHGFASDTNLALEKIVATLSPNENIFKDSYNQSFTTSKDESLLIKLQIYDTSYEKLPTSFLLKGFLTFALPLPINKSINLIDTLYKLSSIFYLFIFPFVLIGIFGILKKRNREGLYLLAVFLLILITILSAGEMIYPRYRILILPFYLIIFALGVTSITKTTLVVISSLLIFIIFIILYYYHEIYNALKLLF